MNILGIDLSVRATGLAMICEEWDPENELFKELPGSQKVCARYETGTYIGALAVRTSTDKVGAIEDILLPVLAWAMHAHQVILEGYSYGSQNMHAVAELGGIIRYHLRKIGQSPVEIAPMSLKKFVAGSGHADKDQMLEAVQRTGLPILDHNMADAFGLAKLGMVLQLPDRDYMEFTQAERETIHAIKYRQVKKKKVKEPLLFKK